jgi:hypothetical protein
LCAKRYTTSVKENMEPHRPSKRLLLGFPRHGALA